MSMAGEPNTTGGGNTAASLNVKFTGDASSVTAAAAQTTAALKQTETAATAAGASADSAARGFAKSFQRSVGAVTGFLGALTAVVATATAFYQIGLKINQFLAESFFGVANQKQLDAFNDKQKESVELQKQILELRAKAGNQAAANSLEEAAALKIFDEALENQKKVFEGLVAGSKEETAALLENARLAEMKAAALQLVNDNQQKAKDIEDAKALSDIAALEAKAQRVLEQLDQEKLASEDATNSLLAEKAKAEAEFGSASERAAAESVQRLKELNVRAVREVDDERRKLIADLETLEISANNRRLQRIADERDMRIEADRAVRRASQTSGFGLGDAVLTPSQLTKIQTAGIAARIRGY